MTPKGAYTSHVHMSSNAVLGTSFHLTVADTLGLSAVVPFISWYTSSFALGMQPDVRASVINDDFFEELSSQLLWQI